MSTARFRAPQRGASLMLAFRMQAKSVLIIGSNRLAASRALSAMEADSNVLVIASGGYGAACEELKWRAEQKEVEIVDWDSIPTGSSSAPTATAGQAIEALERLLDSRGPFSLVCVTDTLLSLGGSKRRSKSSAADIHHICRKRNIPINVADIPVLCDFTFSATYRFTDPEDDSRLTPLQIAVTTNGQGCRLAGRIRREIVSHLPSDSGVAVENVGRLRALSKEIGGIEDAEEDEINDEMIAESPNRPVPQRSFKSVESESQRARRRMKWVSQISEYWSISRLAKLSEEEMVQVLSEDIQIPDSAKISDTNSQHSFDVGELPSFKLGKVLLVGSGPGHPSLLTVAAHRAITQEADIILTDKLVPEGVLSLIPSDIEVRVARKFPGNAEGAQQEMMDAAVAAAKAGKTVVRLKQGDPMLYGRAGEEVLFCRSHGIEALVIPGITSALAAPLFAQIPVTQRGVAESLVICTGVGRRGKDVQLPGYVRSRTLVVLMGVARINSMISALTESDVSSELDAHPSKRRDGARYPPCLPIAIIERASMPDQRVIASTLKHIEAALESTGEQRPPGLFVVGWAVLSLFGSGDVDVLDVSENDTSDEQRVERWLGSKQWRIIEGINPDWDSFMPKKSAIFAS